MGSAIVVVFPPETTPDAVEAQAERLAREYDMASVSVIGWPPDLGAVAELLEPT